MFRILHTSDWHLGHVLYNYSRADEQQHMLLQVEDYVRQYEPDALVVSGDIYHTAMPSAATQRMFTDALLAIHRARPEMTIVITGGNHDSASKLEIDRRLWLELGVHVLGRLQLTDSLEPDFDSHIIRVANRGLIAAVPHVYPQNFPAAEGNDRQAAFFARLADEVAQRNSQQLPTVLMAHLTVTGSDLTGHSRLTDTVGTIDNVPLSALGEGYDYIALGHIHREQAVGCNARYSGSPLAVSFDEDYPHSLTLVDIGDELSVQQLPITNLHPLITVPADPVPFDEAIAALRQGEKWSMIRLNILTESGLPADAIEVATEAAEESGCRFCTFKITRSTPLPSSAAYDDITPDELKEMSPIDIARRFLQQRGLPEDESIQLLSDLISQHLQEIH